jgi:hypothetical protein
MDELRLLVCPEVLGAGDRLFGENAGQDRAGPGPNSVRFRGGVVSMVYGPGSGEVFAPGSGEEDATRANREFLSGLGWIHH